MTFTSPRNILSALFVGACMLAPLPSLAALPSISNVYPTTVTSNVMANLSASVAAGSGIQMCRLYVDLADVGQMTIVGGVAIYPYTFLSGGSHIAFVYCRYTDGTVNSGNETAIWVNGAISGGSTPFSDSNAPQSSPAPVTTPLYGTPAPTTNVTVTVPTTPAPVAPIAGVEIGSLIKLNCSTDTSADSSCQAVYYYGADGKRHAFANSNVFFTWYSDFGSVQTIDASMMARIPLGKNVTYRPGSRMVKFTTDNRVYAVSKGGTLRWVANEDVAHTLYGANWNTKIDDIPDTEYGSYTFGGDITASDSYNPASEMGAASKIDSSL